MGDKGMREGATTGDYRNATSGQGDYGSLGYEWSDKPHRLVYDLCNEVERLRSELKQARELLRPLARHADNIEKNMDKTDVYWGGLTKWDELAEAALTAIEEAGYVIVPSSLSLNKRRVLEAMCQADAGAKSETVSAPAEPLQADLRAGAERDNLINPDNGPSSDKIHVRAEGRRAYGNGYDHYECPDIYKTNGMARHWLDGWVEGGRERSGRRPKADLGYCLCGTVWNIAAIAEHGYQHGMCPDCGEKAAFVERAALSLIEEPANAGDEVTAASAESSLTPGVLIGKTLHHLKDKDQSNE